MFTWRKDELKLQGNKAFEIKDYDAAIPLYSMALKLDDTDATLYSNRSICWRCTLVTAMRLFRTPRPAPGSGLTGRKDTTVREWPSPCWR